MATLGRREVIKKPHPGSLGSPIVGITGPIVNLSILPVKIQPLATLGMQPIFFGSPIMREDFITATGIMPSRLV